MLIVVLMADISLAVAMVLAGVLFGSRVFVTVVKSLANLLGNSWGLFVYRDTVLFVFSGLACLLTCVMSDTGLQSSVTSFAHSVGALRTVELLRTAIVLVFDSHISISTKHRESNARTLLYCS